MLGVIVIMGLILIVVFPSMSRMIHNNNNQEFNNYHDVIVAGAQVYAGTLTDKLGTSKYQGCAEITLSTLIDNGYVQNFDDDAVTCQTGSGNIKIRNDKGNITVNFQLRCTKNGKDEYVVGTNDSSACNPYAISEDKNLKLTFENDSSLQKTSPDGNTVYIKGGNNYIYYSGKLWRAVSYDIVTETVKAVTNDTITSIYYNHANSSAYASSDVETWLNNEFLNSLKDSSTFLSNASWNSTPNTNINDNASSNDKLHRSRVGLISTYELGKIDSWYNNGSYTWLLSEGSSGNSLYARGTAVTSSGSTTILGVRPTVVFSPDVLVYSGSGTSSSPYIIDNTAKATGKVGENINTRYSGEYVTIGGNKYRIVSNDGQKVKVIGTSKLMSGMFSDNHYDYASSSLRASIEANSALNSNLISNGDFCLDTINNANLVYQSSKCLSSSRLNSNIKVGLPKIGDLFSTAVPGVTNNYWTINPNVETDASGNNYNATMNVITPNGGVATATISSTNDVVVVFYLDSLVKISGGSGTDTSPYSLTK